MGAKFRTANRQLPMLFSPCIDDWVKPDHLARFIVDILSKLNLRRFEDSYQGVGSDPYHPSVLLGVLFYGYATGIFSSRKLAQATYDLVPMRYICGDLHPDHDTIAAFRKRFLKEIEEVFIQILLIAHEMGVLQLGAISLDGTKIKANASKHKALSYEYAKKLEVQLQEEIKMLMGMAEAADQNDQTPKLNIPEEIARREDRLERIMEAKKEIEARAKARYEEEKRDYDLKIKARQEEEKQTGKKLKGRAPKVPKEKPLRTEQVNFTDEESRIMPGKGGDFEQAYNAQAAVDVDTMLIVENHISQCSNDKKEVEPFLEEIAILPEALGKANQVLADSGYFSEANINRIEKSKLEPYVAHKRDPHNSFLKDYLASQLPAQENTSQEKLSAVEKMDAQLKTAEGKKLYAKRKSTIEPTFGIIKHVMGFRQFLLRGKVAVSGEWNLVCTAFNIKRLHRCSVPI